MCWDNFPFPPKNVPNFQWKVQVLVALSLTCPHPPVDGHLSLHPGPPHNKYVGGILGSALISPSPSSSSNQPELHDEDGEDNGELQAGLDVDQPAAPPCHRIAGHYPGDATSLGEETPPRTDSSNNDEVCCRLLFGKLGKITMLRDPPLPPLWEFFWFSHSSFFW